jgi:pyruvate dehydrogenase (quinone)
MASTADVMVATLRASGVRRVYGIPGDSLNGFTDAMRRVGHAGAGWLQPTPAEVALIPWCAGARVRARDITGATGRQPT